LNGSIYREGARRARSALVLFACAAALAVSCGGPYAPKKVNLASEKLAIADRLFGSGSYGRSAIEYKDFLATFAGDERSDYAQFRLAESYRLDEQYALAQIEYQILMHDYGYSEYIDDAFFLEGLCAFLQAPRVERDQTKTYEALDRLNRFVQTFPSSPRIAEARGVIRDIHERIGEKDFISAKLYFSKKEYTAALIYFNKVIDLDPDTVWAARSLYYRGRIEESRTEETAAADDYRKALSAKADFPERKDAERRVRLLSARVGGVPTSDGG
jgi:outer membrane protein assembly factor BamD